MVSGIPTAPDLKYKQSRTADIEKHPDTAKLILLLSTAACFEANYRHAWGRFRVGGVRCHLPVHHPAIRHMDTARRGVGYSSQANTSTRRGEGGLRGKRKILN